MKKIFLFLFLLAIVSAKTLVLSNSLSPPQSTVATLVMQSMLQSLSAETPQLDVCFFERDVPCLVWFENLQSILPDVSVGQTANFQVLNNPNYSRNFFGKSDVILQATSPKCRTVLTVVRS